jgi:hypothetical protein
MLSLWLVRAIECHNFTLIPFGRYVVISAFPGAARGRSHRAEVVKVHLSR